MTYQLQSHTITFEAALRDLSSRNGRIRAMAAHALGDVLDPAERARAVAVLIDALRDELPAVRSEAALSLGDLESEAAVEPLLAVMTDEVPLVRQSAVIALGRLGFASSFDGVAQLLEGAAPGDVRFQAATSLAEIDPDRAVPHLIAALSDDDGEVVGAAALALGSVGDASALEPLADQLEQWDDPRARFDIAYALAELGDARSVPVLADFVRDRDVAWDAIEALERTGHSDAIAPLATLVGERRTTPRLALRAAAAVLHLAAGADEQPAEPVAAARKSLLAGVRARKLDHRGLAVSLLGAVGSDWAVSELRALRGRRAGRKLLEEIDAALEQIEARTAGDA